MFTNPSKLCLATCLGVLCVFPGQAIAVLYTGSGTSGFGGAIGGSTMDWTDDGSTVSVNFTKGGGLFNDVFVLYLDTGATGRDAIGPQVSDRPTADRAGVSYIDRLKNLSLNFPVGFEASNAISINSSAFGGLFSIPPTGDVNNNELGFIGTVGNPSSNSASSFTFSFDLLELGLTPNSGAEIKFLGTYLNPYGGTDSHGFASNEGYGSGFPGSNIGQADFTFSGSPYSYVTAVPEPSAFLFGGLVCCLVGLKYTRKLRAPLLGGTSVLAD